MSSLCFPELSHGLSQSMVSLNYGENQVPPGALAAALTVIEMRNDKLLSFSAWGEEVGLKPSFFHRNILQNIFFIL